MKTLYYGDNLEVLRKYVKEDTVDLCYIDPPFNSKRNYHQIYNNIGKEDSAQAQAFTDTWEWGDRAQSGYTEILANDMGRFASQTVDLIKGLQPVLGKGSLLSYLVSMALRITEIHRVLKTNGSFYLHCDPTASHYLKLLLDAIFVSQGGNYINEIVWCYDIGGRISQKAYGRRHDILLFYSKSKTPSFNWQEVLDEFSDTGIAKFKYEDENGKYRLMGRFLKDSPLKGHRDVSPTWEETHPELVYRHYLKEGKMQVDFWNIAPINQSSKERMGYPTQKPEALLDRIIRASSNEGDIVLDAYCGCGTTIAVAEKLKRNWIGIDITYQSIALILRRLEPLAKNFKEENIILNGIPKDMESAQALAHKQDDRLRKEFEKWAILTYSENRAVINDKKGADRGIDGVAFSMCGKDENAKIVFQVKSGHAGRGDIAKLNSDRLRENAEIAFLLTLQEPTKGMMDEAREAGSYLHPLMGRNYPRIQIVTIEEIIEQKRRMDIPLSHEVLKLAPIVESPETQMELFEESL